MNRIDVHCHFLPQLDDGCSSLSESLSCLRVMAANGYDRIFCTPHCGAHEFTHLTPAEVQERVRTLQGHADAAGIKIQLRPGGELRLSERMTTALPPEFIPTFGNNRKYVLADLWEPDWPAWATRGIEWLQKLGYTVILAHPERMNVLRQKPDFIDELARLGLLFQGNLSPIGGGESQDINLLSHRYLMEGRYFMVGTDGHRPSHMPPRTTGLSVIEKLVGAEKLDLLTVKNPSHLWRP
jgi:protein-tyrosine phosphatase